MQNCIIFNTKDCLVNICSGEDFDLDMNFVINNEIIRNSVVEGLPIVNVDDHKREPTEGLFTTKNRVTTITNSFGNLIGKLSNYGATNSAFGNASDSEATREKIKENMMQQLNTLVKLTHYQMEAIDSPKTSYVPTIPKDLKVRVKPMYMKYIAKHKGYELHEKKQIKMPCALNNLCWDMEHFYNSIKWDFGDAELNRNIATEFMIDVEEMKSTENIKDLVEKVENILKEYYKSEQKINLWAKKSTEELNFILENSKEIKRNTFFNNVYEKDIIMLDKLLTISIMKSWNIIFYKSKLPNKQSVYYFKSKNIKYIFY
jgi:hypothetical protein